SLKEKVPFVLLPHILPDLPIYVIWSEDPSESSTLFSQLQLLATRFIFDSESIKDLSTFAHTLLNFEKTFHCDIADLNWARIENWRLLIGSTFHSEERLNTLKQATEIQIVYNTRETATYHTQFQPLYLQGWLATQL